MDSKRKKELVALVRQQLGGIRQPDYSNAECGHCGARFKNNDGPAKGGFALCPACDARD